MPVFDDFFYMVCKCEHEHMTDLYIRDGEIRLFLKKFEDFFLFQALMRHEASVVLQENPIFGGLLRLKCSKTECLAELQRSVQLSDTQLNTFTFFCSHEEQ